MGNPVVHFEIVGSNVEQLQSFYHDAFEWEIGPPNPNVGTSYVMVYPRGEGTINGAIGAAVGGYEGHVTFYVGVPDIEDALARIARLGGKVVKPPSQALGGPRIALFRDPEGHIVGLVQITTNGV